ncbi:unnamed protein product, partial [Mesorhabditis spiculigera]
MLTALDLEVPGTSQISPRELVEEVIEDKEKSRRNDYILPRKRNYVTDGDDEAEADDAETDGAQRRHSNDGDEHGETKQVREVVLEIGKIPCEGVRPIGPGRV